jgi:hypothetical protein
MKQANLEKIISDQRKELHALDQKCKLLTLQLKVIQDIDYYKSRLMIILPNTPYKKILTNEMYKREVESVFNKPFDECLSTYEEMLNIRNQIVHKYTSSDWKNKDTIYNRKFTNKSLTELAKFEY